MAVLILIGLGVVDLILYYLSGTSNSTTGLFGLLNRYTIWPLVSGFVFIAAGFGLATQWR